jgi:endonuclease G
MKRIVAILLTTFALTASAWEQRAPLPVQACQVHSPYGFAQTKRQVQPICREAYLVAYDAPVKIPAYVAYTLKPENALGCFPRTNAFVADQSLNGTGARPDDYVGTGYDKGHAAPDGDLSYNQQVEYESFLMTNMYPQHGSLNRGIWKLLETSVRGWAVQRNQSFKYCERLIGQYSAINRSQYLLVHSTVKVMNHSRELLYPTVIIRL